MKHKTVRRTGILVGLCLVAIVMVVRGNRLQDPLKPEDIVGSWVGYDGSRLCFYRLLLQSGNQGSCALLFSDEAAETYRVVWTLNGRTLSLRFSPSTISAEKMRATVTYVDALGMDLVTEGASNRWRQKVSVYKEGELLRRIAKCVEAQKALDRKL